MGQPETKVAELYRELGVTRQTLYRHVSPQGALRPDGDKLLARGGGWLRSPRQAAVFRALVLGTASKLMPPDHGHPVGRIDGSCV
jgi:hypothetical protein